MLQARQLDEPQALAIGIRTCRKTDRGSKCCWRWHPQNACIGRADGQSAARLHRGHEIAHENALQQGKLEAGGAVDLAMLRQLLRELEHTWGVDVKK